MRGSADGFEGEEKNSNLVFKKCSVLSNTHQSQEPGNPNTVHAARGLVDMNTAARGSFLPLSDGVQEWISQDKNTIQQTSWAIQFTTHLVSR